MPACSIACAAARVHSKGSQVQVVDDGELGKKKGLKLPEAIKEYQKEIDKDRGELAKIPTVFPDKGILGGGYSSPLTRLSLRARAPCVRARALNTA